MELLLILAVFVVMFWGICGGLLIWIHHQKEGTLAVKIGPALASFLYGGFFISLGILGTVFALPISVYAFFVISSLALLYAVAKCRNIKYWVYGLPILCCAGTFVINKLIPGFNMSWYGCVGYTLFWTGFMGLFFVFDRVPCCSFIQNIVWGGSALLAMTLFARIPSAFTVTGSILFVCILSLSKIMAPLHLANFGSYLNVLVSFLWGALFTFALMNGATWTVVFMLNAYIFALTFGAVLSWQLLHHVNFSGEVLTAIFSKDTHALAMRSVLVRCGLLSVLGILLWGFQLEQLSLWAGAIVMLIMFIDLYNRLRDGGTPAPGICQILSSMTRELAQHVKSKKQKISEVKQSLSARTSVRRTGKTVNIKKSSAKGRTRKKK